MIYGTVSARWTVVPFVLTALSTDLALGAGIWFAVGELTTAPHPITDATPLQYALGNMPFYVFIFGIGALIAWAIARWSRVF